MKVKFASQTATQEITLADGILSTLLSIPRLDVNDAVIVRQLVIDVVHDGEYPMFAVFV